MTIALANSTPVQDAGNGSATVFSYPWKIFSASDLVVGFITNGTYVQQSVGFTVGNVGANGGGTVTFQTPPPVGTTVDLRPLTVETQPTEFANLAQYLPENTTNAADRLTRMVQDVTRRTYTYGIHGPDTELAAWPALPNAAGRANGFLAFDANGLPTISQSTSGGTGITQSQFNTLLLSSPGAPAGVYSATFQSGYIQFTGPGQSLQASPNFLLGLNLPNPSGTPGAAALWGSGGGNGTNVQFWHITDQAFDINTPGNDVWHTAGETQPLSTARGGNWTVIAGASDLGTGGNLLLQGGTSRLGPPGLTVLQGANNTGGNKPAGNVFVIGGQGGNAGGMVALVSTILNGIAAPVRVSVGSDVSHTSIMADFIPIGNPTAGSQPFGLYLYSGNGYGLAGQPLVSGGPSGGVSWQTGYTGTLTIGTGTMTFASGILTGITGTPN